VSERSAIILFAHGARDPEWAEPFRRIQALVANTLPGTPVELAFLERMTPGLPEALGRVVQAGATTVSVVPLFLGAGGHVKEDVAALVRTLREQHPTLKLQLSSPIGEDEELVSAIAQWVVRQHLE